MNKSNTLRQVLINVADAFYNILIRIGEAYGADRIFFVTVQQVDSRFQDLCISKGISQIYIRNIVSTKFGMKIAFNLDK